MNNMNYGYVLTNEYYNYEYYYRNCVNISSSLYKYMKLRIVKVTKFIYKIVISFNRNDHFCIMLFRSFWVNLLEITIDLYSRQSNAIK